MNGPTILDGLHNSSSGKNVHLAYFLSGDILIKLYSMVRTAESGITLPRVPNFVRQPYIHEIHYRGGLMI